MMAAGPPVLSTICESGTHVFCHFVRVFRADQIDANISWIQYVPVIQKFLKIYILVLRRAKHLGVSIDTGNTLMLSITQKTLPSDLSITTEWFTEVMDREIRSHSVIIERLSDPKGSQRHFLQTFTKEERKSIDWDALRGELPHMKYGQVPCHSNHGPGQGTGRWAKGPGIEGCAAMFEAFDYERNVYARGDYATHKHYSLDENPYIEPRELPSEAPAQNNYCQPKLGFGPASTYSYYRRQAWVYYKALWEVSTAREFLLRRISTFRRTLNSRSNHRR